MQNGKQANEHSDQAASALRWSPVTRLLTAALLLIATSAIALLLLFNAYLNSTINVDSDTRYFSIERGSSVRTVAAELQRKGVLDNSQLFVWLARWRGDSGSLQVGEYELNGELTPLSLLAKFTSGDTRQYRVTLVEGWTFSAALAAVQASDGIRVELNSDDPAAIAELLGLDWSHPEGSLFPDTYFYTAGTSDVELLRRAADKLQRELDAQWQQRLGALPLSSPYEALILASIIEKESSQQSERGHIAGVFIRRLEQGMRLQSDPTVIYGLGERYDGNIIRAHLREVTPYNTYRVNGLPPTPIALAGRESLRASVHPLPSDYLYFVAKGDGAHYFSATLEEHNAAVNRFQRGIKEAE